MPETETTVGIIAIMLTVHRTAVAIGTARLLLTSTCNACSGDGACDGALTNHVSDRLTEAPRMCLLHKTACYRPGICEYELVHIVDCAGMI